jgi:hypothetical protein
LSEKVLSTNVSEFLQTTLAAEADIAEGQIIIGK